jgi:hypothetical protein
MNSSLRYFVRIITTSGITILVAYISSWIVLVYEPFHTDQRAGAIGVMAPSAGLELLWAIAGTVLAVTRWSITTRTFRLVYVLNVSIAFFLFCNIVSSR